MSNQRKIIEGIIQYLIFYLWYFCLKLKNYYENTFYKKIFYKFTNYFIFKILFFSFYFKDNNYYFQFLILKKKIRIYFLCFI